MATQMQLKVMLTGNRIVNDHENGKRQYVSVSTFSKVLSLE